MPRKKKKEKVKAKAAVKKKTKKKKAKPQKVKKPPKTKKNKKFAKEFHKKMDEKKVINADNKKSEEELKNMLAMIREKVAEDDKLKNTLKKLSEQVKEEEEPNADEIKNDLQKSPKDKEIASKGYGILSSDTMNLLEKKYYDEIWKKIKEAWILPSGISKKNKDLVTIIVIRIEKNGNVSKISIEKTSRSDYYDQSALRAIKKAEPFPKFIEGMNRDFFKVGIRFRPTEH